MPLLDYEVECHSCGAIGKIEILDDKIIEERYLDCPKCGTKAKAFRIWNSPLSAVHFKGSGFFVNDYPKK